MILNIWHAHNPKFIGTHSHEIDGTELGHTHAEDGAVEAFGGRYKKPKAVIAPDAEATTLEVDSVKHVSKAKNV